MIVCLAVLSLLSTSCIAKNDQKMQKEQLEKLLASVLPFAQMMLEKSGEFYPYGATMSAEGQITDVGGYTGDEHPKSVEVINLLTGGFKASATVGKIMACALVVDVRVIPPGQVEKTDAISVRLDHRDGMSVIMFYPYQIGPDKKVLFGQPFAQKGPGEIFGKN